MEKKIEYFMTREGL